jgi:cytochrome c oxidase cbb3-type subunit 3
MADFTSGFWDWYIIVPVVLGIVWLFVLISRVGGGDTPQPGEQVETMGHVWDEDLEEYNNPLPKWWLNMFYITLIFGVVYLALYPGLGSYKGMLGWTELSQYEAEMAQAEEVYGPIFAKFLEQPLEQVAQDDEALRMGERLFVTYCATCHGSDARGARGFPNLRDGEWLYGNDAATIKQTIAQGRSGVMPPWGAALGDLGVAQMAEYVVSLSGREHDRAQAAQAAPKFAAMCATCHGAQGGGNQSLGAPALNNRVWQYGGSLTAIRESIQNGRNGVMPAHAEFLGEAKVHLLAAYVLSLQDR